MRSLSNILLLGRLRQTSICGVALHRETLNVALLRLAPCSSRALQLERFPKPVGFYKPCGTSIFCPGKAVKEVRAEAWQRHAAQGFPKTYAAGAKKRRSYRPYL
jgi:hypothetical protein